MTEKQPRGLMIHNNPFSYTTGNGKTIANMFAKWDAENLAQIYVSNLEPDFNICRHYFKVTDREAARSFLFHSAIGNEITGTLSADGAPAQTGNLKRVLKSILYESYFVAYVRDYIWRKSNWNNEKFNSWLDAIQPEFVVLAGGNISVFYDMAEYICQKYKIPFYIHLGDDYYINRSGFNVWKNLQRKRMSEKLRKGIKLSECNIAICDKMARVFKKEYGGNYMVCMNSVNVDPCRIPLVKKSKSEVLSLVYAGNLGINRWKILNLIGQALKELLEEGVHTELCIYSSYTPEDRIQRKLSIPPVMKFCGSVFGEELTRIKSNADILVHVESFEKKYRQLTYTAMSTKIPEYLSAGRIILGVGPEEAASIEFLEENHLALIVKERSVEAIKQQIRRYWNDFEGLKAMTELGREVAAQRFSKEKNASEIYDTIVK